MWRLQKKEWEKLLNELVGSGAFHESDVFKTVGLLPQAADMLDFLDLSMGDYLQTE
jgi:hypothetical protein